MEPDAQLRRVERTAIVAWALTAAAAAVTGGGWRAIEGVAAGGALVAVSYRGIRGGIDAAVTTLQSDSDVGLSRSAAWRFVKFVTRLAMLALIAYVMMVRLRAQPGWMLAGATSLVAAVGIEAVRQLRARP